MYNYWPQNQIYTYYTCLFFSISSIKDPELKFTTTVVAETHFIFLFFVLQHVFAFAEVSEGGPPILKANSAVCIVAHIVKILKVYPNSLQYDMAHSCFWDILGHLN